MLNSRKLRNATLAAASTTVSLLSQLSTAQTLQDAPITNSNLTCYELPNNKTESIACTPNSLQTKQLQTLEEECGARVIASNQRGCLDQILDEVITYQNGSCSIGSANKDRLSPCTLNAFFGNDTLTPLNISSTPAGQHNSFFTSDTFVKLVLAGGMIAIFLPVAIMFIRLFKNIIKASNTNPGEDTRLLEAGYNHNNPSLYSTAITTLSGLQKKSDISDEDIAQAISAIEAILTNQTDKVTSNNFSKLIQIYTSAAENLHHHGHKIIAGNMLSKLMDSSVITSSSHYAAHEQTLSELCDQYSPSINSLGR